MIESKYISKIRIIDDIKTRKQIIDIIDMQNKTIVSKWAINNAIRILELVGFDVRATNLIQKGIEFNNKYNNNQISVMELREIGFEVHKLAKIQENQIIGNALRAFGHAISTEHMKEHGIISSDYIIKTLNLLKNSSFDVSQRERNTQLKKLNEIILNNNK